MSGEGPAELVLRGGPVFTGQRWVEAVAVRGGRVVAAGSEADVRGWLGGSTHTVDLTGRCALPGFHDAHTHLLGGAIASRALDVGDVRSADEIAGRVAARLAARRAERVAAGLARDAGADQRAGWIAGRGWDADRFPGRALPTRACLDAVAPDVPVVLRRRDGHAALANGRALELAGITAARADPPGGRIARDAAGAPTGLLLEEPAIDLVERLLPMPSAAEQEEALAEVAARAASLGITSVQDDPSFDDRLDGAARYAALLETGRLPLRATVWRRLGRPLDELAAEERALAARGLPPDRVRFGLLKGYLDGSLGSRTALLCDPYCDEPQAGLGVSLDPDGAVRGAVAEAHRAGYQVGLHAIGDRAAEQALEAFAAAGDGPSLRAARHRVEHAQMLQPRTVARLSELGAIASLQPIHLAGDMQVAAERLGPDRCGWLFPFASLLRAGAPLAFGTDFPVEVLPPWLGLFCAATHRSPRAPADPPLTADEAIPLDAALAAYTAGAAWAARQEQALGGLVPGAWADVAVLDRDLTAAAPEALLEARCLVTLLAGSPVHVAEGAQALAPSGR